MPLLKFGSKISHIAVILAASSVTSWRISSRARAPTPMTPTLIRALAPWTAPSAERVEASSIAPATPTVVVPKKLRLDSFTLLSVIIASC